MRRFIALPLIALLSACAHMPATTRAPAALSAPQLPTLGPYAQAVRAGQFVFVSGVVAYDPSTQAFAPPDIEAQTRQALANLKSVLDANGLATTDVVKTTVFLKNPADVPGMNATYAQFFQSNLPARTTVPGADWGRPDILIEIEAIAVHR